MSGVRPSRKSPHAYHGKQDIKGLEQKAIRHYLGGKNVSELARKVGVGRSPWFLYLPEVELAKRGDGIEEEQRDRTFLTPDISEHPG